MNIGGWIKQRSWVHPERPFLKEEDHPAVNNRAFNLRVNRMARALTDLGVTRGERIATLMNNSSTFLEIFFACAKTGAIMVPVNFRLSIFETTYILQDCTPRALVYSADFAGNVQKLKAACPAIAQWLRHDGAELPEDPDITGLAAAMPEQEPAPNQEVTLKDPLFIMYTAGTTGNPKGAVLTHENILFGAINTVHAYGINNNYKSLVSAPLFHIGALGASTTPIIYAGGSLVLKSFFNASAIIQLIMREKINYVFAIPVMFQLLTKSEEWKQADFSHVHFFISGGAPIPLPVIQKYQEEKGVRFAQGYGLTETVRLTSLDLEDSIRKAGSVGKEVFHVELRIVDQHDRDVAPGETGEIIVRGPNVFAGYWNKPVETAAAMKGGWFHTGDLGRRDAEGFLYIIGRKVEMIISSGENIYPAEVEKALQALPQVREAAAVGMPDWVRGEVVAAFVALKDGAAATEDDLIQALEEKIAPYKVPKKIIFVQDFPRNAAGKVLKKDLKALLNQETA